VTIKNSSKSASDGGGGENFVLENTRQRTHKK